MMNYGVSTSPLRMVIALFFLFVALLAEGSAAQQGLHRTPLPLTESTGQVQQYIARIDSRNNAFLLDTMITYVPAGDHQYEPAIAFDGTNYLAVWRTLKFGSHYNELFSTRVSPSGTVLDPAGISISARFTTKFFPSVAFNGTNYLVVWEESEEEDIYGTRVSPEGTVLDLDGIMVSVAPGWQCDPAVASDGINYLAVWTDSRPGVHDDLYGARISPSGTLLDPDGIVIATAPGFQGGCNVVFDGTNYFVVWCDTRSYDSTQFDIYAARVSPAGIVLDPDGIAISTEANDQSDPAVAFDGTNYLVAWIDDRSGLYDIYCARVNQSGVLIDTTAIFVDSTEFDWQTYISATFDGVNFLVVWQDSFVGSGGWVENMDVHGARVTPSGVVLDTIPIHISTEQGWQYKTAAASDGTNSLVVWCDGRSSLTADIYGARLDHAGNVLEPEGIIISSSANYQDNSASVYDGTNYLVVWQDDRNGEFDIYGTRISESGSILDPSCVSLSVAKYHQTKPSVAFDGTNYLTVWEDLRNYSFDPYKDIYGARMNQSGILIDTPGIAISIESGGQESPAVVFGDSNYLVVWEYYNTSDIYGARVNQSGVVLDTDGIVIATTGTLWKPSVAFDGTNYLVAWRDGGANASDIYGTRIDQSGHVIDTNNIAISTAPGIQDAPSVAFDGVNYLVVWGDERSSIEADIYCARINTSGVILDTTGMPISTAAGVQSQPFVAYDGTDYIVVWQDTRNGPFFDLYGAKIDTSGEVIDSFIVAAQGGHQQIPRIADGPGEQLLVTYTGWADSINDRPANAMRIWGRFYPFTGIEEQNSSVSIHPNIELRVYPVPFSDKVNVEFKAPNTAQSLELRIYDATGRLVKSLDLEHDMAHHTRRTSWDGTDQTNRRVPNGVYFLKVYSLGNNLIEKLLLIR